MCELQHTMKNSQRIGSTRLPYLSNENSYADQEATVRSRHGTSDWFQIGKGVWQGCILSPCLFNFYAKYIMQISGLDESQAGIKIARRNISNLRYADDNSLMADSEEELKNLLMRDEEESDKVDLKLNIKKLRSWHLVPTLHVKLTKMWQQWQILLGSKITVDGDCSHKIKKHLLLGRKSMTNLKVC